MDAYMKARLTTLITDSLIGKKFNDKKKETVLHTITTYTNTNFIINRISDTIKIHSILFDNNNDIHDIIKLDIYIGGSCIWSIDKELLFILCKVENNIIYIPDNLFFINKDFLPMIALIYHEVFIYLETKNRPIEYKIRFIGTLLDSDERKNSYHKEHSLQIYQYKQLNKITNTNKVDLDKCLSSKGFYIITNKINSISLIINDLIYFTYSFQDIKDFGKIQKLNNIKIIKKLKLPNDMCNIISNYVGEEYIYYIPISTIDNNYYLDLCRYDKPYLIFDKEYHYKTYSIERNILKIMTGLGGIVF